jgi:hypothetical protein
MQQQQQQQQQPPMGGSADPFAHLSKRQQRPAPHMNFTPSQQYTGNTNNSASNSNQSSNQSSNLFDF